VQVSPDGATVWATSHPGMLAAVVDAKTYKLRGHLMTGNGPAHVILTPNGRTAYVTNSEDGTLTAIDARRLVPTGTIRVGRYPHGIRPSPDGRWLYVANLDAGTVSAVSTATGREVAAIPVGKKPVQVAFAPDGRFAYVSLNGENAVAKIDVGARRVVARTKVGTGPVQVYVTPDGKYVLVANQGTEAKPSTTLSVVSTATLEPVATIETGKGAHGVVVDPTGSRAYVTNVYGGDVAVIDLRRLRVVDRIRVGAEPNGISFSPLAPAKPPARVSRLPLPAMAGMEGMGHS